MRMADCGLKCSDSKSTIRNPQSQCELQPTNPPSAIRHPKFSIFRRSGGQSIVEYLAVATAVIAAIMFFKTPVQTAMDDLYGEATNQAWNAADQLGRLTGGGGGGGGCDCRVYWWCC